ncbi:MAG: hypothetical protein ABWZ01_00070 [Methyloceanibacter sp.]
MPDYTRNDIWRLKRTMAHLNKALDSLTRAGGELRPKQFDKLRKTLSEVSGDTEALLIDIESVTQARPQKTFDLDEAAE